MLKDLIYLKNILEIGPISYVGGVSVHINRLTNLLKDDFYFEFIDESPKKLSSDKILNIRSLKDQIKILSLIHRSDVIHIHSGNWIFRIYFMAVASLFNKKFVVTLHSMRLSGWKLSITNFFLKKACKVVAVSEEINLKLPNRLIKKTKILEAFLPPNLKYEPALPLDIKSLIKKYRNKNFTLLAANAFRLRMLTDGELYGLDQCIRVAELARDEKFLLHIIFVIGTVKDEDQDYLESFLNKVQEKKLSDFITVYPTTLSFIRLISEVDVVLRPTLTDGDALTVREALYMNKCVIASNIVKRPIESMLYEVANAKDLFLKIKELGKHKNHGELVKFADNKKNYHKLYSKIYTECNNSHKN